MRCKVLLSVIMLSFLSHFLWAQDRIVSGKVTSAEDGSALPGVNVVVKGATIGTVTDANGDYSISIANGATLVFSFIGFQTSEIATGDRSTVEVSLAVDVTQLSEVIITTFGEAKKSAFTGSATTISSDQLLRRPVSNLFQSVAGSGPGIVTTAGSGQPGSAPAIRIRGFGSITNDNEPLYVVDGVPFTANLVNLNPDDIESLTVLKDAASTSLYGSRGSNGVIMVTTKKGKSGKATVNLRYTKGFSDRGLPEYDRIGASDYYPIMWEANRNSFAYRTTNPVPIATASQNASNNLQSLLGYNVYDVPFDQLVDVNGVLNPNARLLYDEKELNWEDPLMRRGNRDEFSFNLSGANDKTDYFFSSSYLKDIGYLIRSDFERFTSRLNVNTQIKSWLKAGANVTAALSTAKQADAGTSGSFVNPFNFSRNIGPIFPVYAFDPAKPGSFLLRDGKRFYDYGNMSALGLPNRPVNAGRHVVAETELNSNDVRRNVLGGRAYAEFIFLRDFKFTLNAGTDLTNLYSTDYQNPEIGDGAPAGRASHRYDNIFSTNFNQLLNYSRTFGDHNISALLGHESFEARRNFLDGSRSAQILDGNIEFGNFTTTTNLNSQVDENSVEGYFSRVNYDFKEKYFASVSVRRDGSSRFSRDVRWGNFYSISGAWRIDQEKFMNSISQISSLKLRTSFGQNGNEAILDNNNNPDYYPNQPLFGLGWNNATEPGILQESLGNQLLSWETADQFDVALEFGLFKNRITGSAEYFSRASRDLIFSVPLPISSGVASIIQNIGKMVNNGIEIEINAQVVNLNGFTWDFGINATMLKNEITKMPEATKEIIQGTKKLSEGRSINDFWLREYMGVNPDNGEAWYRADNFVAANSLILESGDTVTSSINNARFHYNGSSIPDVSGGITNTFMFKGFTLSAILVYQLGGKTYDGAYAGLMGSGGYGSAKHPDILKRWRNPGDISDVPRMDAGRTADFDAASDRWLTDADFLNIRSISLSYDLPRILLQKANITKAQIFVSGENLAFISKRNGMNVQQNFGGTTSNVFSPNRSIVTGVSLSF